MGKKTSFFAKIGNGFAVAFKAIVRFISTNAWLQPILVVGLIFVLIFSLTGIPKVIDCINEWGNNTEEKIKDVNNLNDYNTLKARLDQSDNGDYILIFGKESCPHCQALNKFINNYQDNNNFGKIDNLYYFETTDLMEEVYENNEEKSKLGIDKLTYILTTPFNGGESIVDTYESQRKEGTDSWPVLQPDTTHKHSWFNDEYTIETPTTVFFKDGKAWSVVKGPWVTGEHNYSEGKKILDYWTNDNLSDFKKFFNYNY